MEVPCPYCNQIATLVSGKSIYPHRPDLFVKKFYLCRPCNAWVGCHDGTETPLGRLANKALRDAKMLAHATFDPLWKQKKIKRRRAYLWLAQQLGIKFEDCHIGMFDLETCQKVAEICRKKEVS